ncbi:hypothetical protein L1987_33696 [Smallanthus sonchifolius]|uniref:Uncharacterized protein n=1 Tax=Smallanthus sonchifolius TaxID=185202 RepID=A0ACB9HSY9_9ASTR|nr:hypothetical protein L1987_33696 [Smallanthus sonchifolius]
MEHVDDNAYATLSYIDPDYKQGFLTEKSDIYSFGVVLFEILCGRLAWAQDWKDHSQSLGPLAKRCYEEGKLDEMVYVGIKVQIGPESLAIFADIAYKCLHDKSEDRPMLREVVIQLKKALDAQKDYETWEAQLPEYYKEIIQMSTTPETLEQRERIFMTLSKGILIQEGKLWCSLGSNGDINEMVSASQLSYGNHKSQKWRSVPESRFDKIAEMLDISNLNIQIRIRSQFLSSGVNYGVHLVFKFCGARRSVAKQMYVNLIYEMGDETLHAYFATWREDEWMTIELYRFLNHKESDTTDFEFLIKSFSRCYCGNHAIYVEGIEFRAIDNVRPEENNNLMEVLPQLETSNIPFDICSVLSSYGKPVGVYSIVPSSRNRADDIRAESKALARAVNASLYSPELLKFKYASRPFKVLRRTLQILACRVFCVSRAFETSVTNIQLRVKQDTDALIYFLLIKRGHRE